MHPSGTTVNAAPPWPTWWRSLVRTTHCFYVGVKNRCQTYSPVRGPFNGAEPRVMWTQNDRIIKKLKKVSCILKDEESKVGTTWNRQNAWLVFGEMTAGYGCGAVCRCWRFIRWSGDLRVCCNFPSLLEFAVFAQRTFSRFPPDNFDI